MGPLIVFTGLQAALSMAVIFVKPVTPISPWFRRSNIFRLRFHWALRRTAFMLTPGVIILISIVELAISHQDPTREALMPFFVFLLTINMLWLLVYFSQYRDLFEGPIRQIEKTLKALKLIREKCIELKFLNSPEAINQSADGQNPDFDYRICDLVFFSAYERLTQENVEKLTEKLEGSRGSFLRRENTLTQEERE